MTPAPPHIIVGYGWKRILLDTGEVIEIYALNGDLPERVRWPMFDGPLRQIVEVLGDAPLRH